MKSARNFFEKNASKNGGVNADDSSSFFWCDEGFSTVGMVLALLITLSLIFTCAQIYEINTVSARVQETADAAVLAAENTVGEFYIVVAVCDAIVFTLSLTMLITLGISVITACILPAAGISKGCLELSKTIRKSRDSFYESAQKSLETLQKALPFIATAKAQEVLAANSGEGSSQFYGIVVLAPWQAETAETLSFDQENQALDSVESSHTELSEQSAKAEEAAQKANQWKEHAFKHDSGSQTEYCMYERAAHLAGMAGTENPYFSSVDTWNFDAALSRAKIYYQLRYENEQPQGSSVDEQANSALRKRFYGFAAQTVGQGYVRESESSFEAVFPLLPKNTDEMRATELYTEAVYPRTLNAQGQAMLHAWEGCPGCALGQSTGAGSISEMDNNAAYATCPYCKFTASSMGKVAAASSNIENGFEYHYNEVAYAASEYQKARAEFDPLSEEVKDLAGGLFEGIFSGLEEACAQRITVLPPGHWGAVALVIDTAAPASSFPSVFVSQEGTASLGVRAALSSATLVRESSDEGKNVLTSFLDGLSQQGGADAAARLVFNVWSGMLGVYIQGHDALISVVDQALNGIPLASASGLGTWAAGVLEEKVDELGFSPPDLSARKAVLVNSGHVLEADDSAFSVRLLSVKNAAIQYGEGGVNGALSAIESAATEAVEELNAEFTIATIVLIEGAVEIPITLSLPSFVSDGISGAFQQGIAQLYAMVASWTGVRQWR